MGDPGNLDGRTPAVAELIENTMVTFKDMDSSPTKAWIVTHRNEPEWKRYFDLAFAPRPREELYVFADDKDQIRNVAADPKHAAIKADLNRRLMDELLRTGDPRVTGDGKTFERPPFTSPNPAAQANKAKKAK